MMENQKADLQIEFEHSENKDTQETIEGIKSILKEQKAKGNLDFKAVTRRKCDYCGKTLTDKDKFKTETLENGDIMDKCEDCAKAGKWKKNLN